MKKSIKVSLILIIVLLIFVVFKNSLKEATFVNADPTIEFDKTKYVVTNKIINEDNLEEKIAKVTQIICLVSYLDKDNPYKNPSKIYKIKERNVNEVVALKMNDKFYIAKIKK